ncbi:hypothetical protein BH10BAC4_BH10BAC4_09900 [soil metagenome]
MEQPFSNSKNDVRIAVIGGGTGSFTMLSGLKHHSKRLAAIVSMADDGGSTGVLRDELGALPPGDVRKCLVALSDTPKIRDLFEYRFEAGTLSGHSFGNILLTALEKVTGSFAEAVSTASEILRINGMVIPATLDDVRLKMEWADESVILQGEGVIDANYFSHDPRNANLSLVPNPKPNPLAITAIEDADIVVITPGDLYTSLGPLLCIDGIGQALNNTKALKVYISNLVTKDGQTAGFTVSDHAAEIERFAGFNFIDYVIYNDQKPIEAVAERYEEEKAYLVHIDTDVLQKKHYKAVGGEFLGDIAEKGKNDTIKVTRGFIRHDSDAIARTVMEIYNSVRKK